MSVTADVAVSAEQKQLSFKRILFATDFSDASDRALNYALALACRYGSELIVVHAVQPEPREPIPLDPLPHELDSNWIKAEEQMVRLTESDGFKAIPHHGIVRRGDVLQIISQVLHEHQCDLLVTGTHGRRGLAKLAIGSIAEQLLQFKTCPVLTIGPSVAPVPKTGVEIARILFATDFGPVSLSAFLFAQGFAKAFNARLVLLHLIEPMPVSEITPAAYGPPSYAAEEFSKWQTARKRDSEERLRDLAASARDLPFPPTFEVGMDLVPEGILETARYSDTNLIVMGVHHADSPRLASHFPWALTSEVIRKAKCPVLTVCA